MPGLFYDTPGTPLGVQLRMAKIKLDIYHLSDDDLIAYMGPIVTKMTGNAAFSSQAARTTALGNATTAFAAGNADYLTVVQTCEQKLTVRTNTRATLEAAARDSVAGAEGITHDAATLQSGGWDIRADAAPVGSLAAPQNLSASLGDHSGTMDLDWDAIRRGVQTYVAEHATAPAGPWSQGYIGRASKCNVAGLTAGTLYYFRVKAVGAAGASEYSDIAEKRAS